jgi:hypothetical protein
MSLVSIAREITQNADIEYNCKTGLIWAINQIDMFKLAVRVVQAQSVLSETKCVLLEYNFTEWKDVNSGKRDRSDRLPETNVLVHTVLSSPNFAKVARKYIAGDEPRADIYIRRKVRSDGTLDPHRYQLVLKFSMERPITPLSYEEDIE